VHLDDDKRNATSSNPVGSRSLPARWRDRPGDREDKTVVFDGADYELRWPRELFRSEATFLLNNRSISDWQGRAELLLEDAFSGPTPADDLRNQPSAFGTLDDRHKYLVSLVRSADSLKQVTERAPYWSERKSGNAPGKVSVLAAVREYVRLVSELVTKGYFERDFEKDCVDDPATVDPSDVIEEAIGVSGLWPLSASQLSDSLDTFYDVIEVLHDHVARPRTRSMHGYAGCGYHHGDFLASAGRELYVWRVNRILDSADLDLRIAADGEDAGRLVAVTDDARAELSHTMASRQDLGTGDRVRHAISLFRRRGATEHDKRSAVVALALVLEERRDLLRTTLLTKDEGALFEIANRFAIRHQNESQRADYSPAFLDWIFWWYLATIELSDRMLSGG
jgi:hypothetical protein